MGFGAWGVVVEISPRNADTPGVYMAAAVDSMARWGREGLYVADSDLHLKIH